MKINKKNVVINLIFIVAILGIWQIVSVNKMLGSNTQLVMPDLGQIAASFIDNFKTGFGGKTLFVYIGNSMRLLITGILLGITLAFILTGIAVVSSSFRSVFNLLVSIFDLLPGIALLPVVITFFGIKESVIIVLVVHSVIWPMSRSILDGFLTVPDIYVEAGRNIGLKGVKLLLGVYIPATTAYIISGIKSGWARAWRGLISAEMIFGIASSPGIGLYINQMRTNMMNSHMYATLIVIILIGIVVQYGIIQPIENMTVRKWGMTK